MNLNGKNIVITGASSGIGKEILKKLIRYNVSIIAVSRNVSKIPANDKVLPYSCDVSVKEEVDKLFEFAEEKFGHIDIFIANAGFAFCEELKEPDWKHIESIFSTNVFSPIYSVEKMRAANQNRKYSVVITCSAVSEMPLPGYSLYCATKHAINGFGRVIQYEAKKNEIISFVYPIATQTNFFTNAAEKAPVPWPVQSPVKVAESVIRGIEAEKRFIYPSKAFAVSRVINRIFPFTNQIYARIQSDKFHQWVRATRADS